MGDAVRRIHGAAQREAAALADRMGRAVVTRVVVTRSDGTLVGLFFAADVTSQAKATAQADTTA